MINCILYGLTPLTDKVLDRLKKQINENNILIKCIVVNESPSYSTLENIRIIMANNCLYEDSFVIICLEQYQETLYNLLSLGLKKSKIIDSNVIINNVLFNFQKYIKIKERNISIVSNSDWGMNVYKSLYLEYNTPFIDTYISPNHYLKIIKSFENYMHMQLEQYCDNTLDSVTTGKLGDILIQFPKEKTFSSAKKKWSSMISNFNFSDYFIEMDNFENEDQLKEFNSINYNKKVAFYFKKTPLALSFPEWDNQKIRKEYRWFDIYTRKTAYRNFNGVKPYNILDLLLGES